MSEAPVANPMEEKVAMMQDFLLNRPWWELIVRGVLITLFGVLAIIYPGLTFAVFIVFFGAFTFIEGIFGMVGSFAAKADNPQWSLMFISGLFSFIVGVIVLSWPGMSALVLLYFIGAWALINGTVQMVMGLRAGEEGARRGATVLGGVIGIAFGMMCLTWPGATAWSIVVIIGILAIFFGLQLIVLGLMSRDAGTPASMAAAA